MDLSPSDRYLVKPVPGPALLDRRLVIVTGKGGVGKSTISAALALIAARRGRRTLVCEVKAQERVAPLLGAPPAGAVIREALPGLSTVNVTPPQAMREYGLMVLKYKTIYDAVFENRLVRYFLQVVPSLAELVMLGKILHEVRAEERGRPRWDLVVVDAPSTGHAVQLLRVPAALLDTVPAGPLRRDAQWMRDLLVDARTTALALVTLPEEMPVNEAIDLDGQVRDLLGIARGGVLVNAMPEPRFTPEEEALLGELTTEAAPVGPAARSATILARRAAQAARQVERLRGALDGPVSLLPLVASARWDRAAVERVADAVEAGGVPWGR
jgi:anion-transporting  ArsA/GET3 family ATPase